MLSCGRAKTGLFENANVAASIHCVSEHAHGSLGITRGHFAYLFSFIEVQTSKFACSSVFVWTEIFSKTLLVWTRIFFYTDKKDAFQNYPDMCGRDLSLFLAKDAYTWYHQGGMKQSGNCVFSPGMLCRNLPHAKNMFGKH